MADRQLYSDGKIRITSSWLIVGRDSHAIRYINSLSHDEWHPPRRHAFFVAIVATLLVLLALVQLINQVLPFGIGWLLLVASTALWIASIYVWKQMPSTFRLTVGFSSGQRLELPIRSAAQLDAVHEKLREALDMHRFDAQPVGQAASTAAAGAGQGGSTA